VSVKPLFRDRHAAGRALGQALSSHEKRPGVVVLGMARGGVAVAAPIAQALGAPLDVFVGRKLGVPGIEEVAFGAIAEGGGAPVIDAVHRFIGLPRGVMAAVVAWERAELDRRIRRYRDGRPLPDLTGRTVIVVDDGLASGATLRAAGIAFRRFRPARLIAAVPVASAEGRREVAVGFDEVVTVATPELFTTVSDWYEDFSPVDDAQVRALVGLPPAVADPEPTSVDSERVVPIPTSESGPTTAMAGDLGGPVTGSSPPRGLVIFAHGGGSSRGSYRNRYLAGRLRMAGWATLRLDLLGDSERQADAERGEVRFDIDLITRRLLTATTWCLQQRVPGSERVVLFGASTGAAAAMGVAAALGTHVAGVVARGGRIDLADSSLSRVRAPTLLVVGGADRETWRLNRESAPKLPGPVTLRVVRGAGHTFEESGALGRVGELVTSWLVRRHRMDQVRRWLTGRRAWRSTSQVESHPAR
jgi:putative phosphoribosyl transferase